MRTALVAGATGLIGGQLLDLLLRDEQYSRVIAISRKPLTSTHPKLQNIIADYTTLVHQETQLEAEDIFCCLGTTMALAKSKEAFRQIDFDYPVLLAETGLRQGARQFLLVSALGADVKSRVFYNRVKGETEAAILQAGFPCVHVFRPSLLIGPRREQRFGEKVAQQVSSVLNFLIPKKYKPIASMRVAQAMIEWAKKDVTGNFIHESSEMLED